MEEQQGDTALATAVAHPTGEASWNPALRHNTEHSASSLPADEEDDFFDRYPGATPKKGQPSLQTQGGYDPASPMRRQSISVQSIVDVRTDDATPEDAATLPSHSVEVAGPLSQEANDEEGVMPQGGEEEEFEEEHDPESAVRNREDMLDAQEAALEEKLADDEVMNQEVDGEQQDAETRVHDSNQDGPGQANHYEHQGELTAMEEAIEPSADAPLMQDEEPLPTAGYVSREPTLPLSPPEESLGLDGETSPLQPPTKSSKAQPQLDRSFTTNFSDMPSDPLQPQRQASSLPSEWPSVGDDQVFGELLDQQRMPVDTRENGRVAEPSAPSPEQEGVEEAVQEPVLDDDELLPEDEGEVKEEDLAAAWGAVLDDDELLDETPTDANASDLFGDEVDDAGFLDDEPVPAPVQPMQQPRSYRPSTQQIPTQIYGGHGRSAGTPSTGLTDLYNLSPPSQQSAQLAQQAPRPGVTQSQSFVDKAKGGYQSPYDLPMEVVKPRRRPQSVQHAGFPMQRPPPPPFAGSSPALGHGPTPSISQSSRPGMPPPRTSSIGSTSAPIAGQQAVSPSPPQSAGTTAAKPAGKPQSGSGFFEDLPVTMKPRSRPMGGQNPSISGMPTPPPSLGHPPSRQSSEPYTPGQPPRQQKDIASIAHTPPTPVQPSQPPQALYGGLSRPEKLPILPSEPSVAAGTVPSPPQPQHSRYSPSSQPLQAPVVPPIVSSRYSPAPSQTSSMPTGSVASRYSPAPGSVPKARTPSLPSSAVTGANVHPFAPRTSSPLAAMHVNTEKPLPASPPRAVGAQQNMSQANKYAPTAVEAPQQNMGASAYLPGGAAAAPPQTSAPPQRPRTQSPDTTMKGPKLSMARPTSSAGVSLPRSQSQQILPTSVSQQSQPTSRPGLPHRRQFSRELSFAAPQDIRAQDPLERWKGCPIFSWSPSGTVLTTFPKHTPYYAAGQGLPSVKCTPGQVTTQDASAFIPMEERNAKFPGPLTAKSKRQKKDVMAWLSGKIEDLQRVTEGAMLDFTLPVEARKRTEERLILWKIIRVFLEHDGVLEGTPRIEEEVRSILLPNLAQMAQVADLQSPASAAAMPDPVDKQVLFQIRQALFEGQRERAVWLAEEKKLWGHAMLIASTMGPDVWKQIVQAFVRSQVKNVGADARSTAALYQVFAGNSEECVDELVPPSARAGFQMISTQDRSVSGNPLEGLDQWRETLGLITSNRTSQDATSLKALGKLLAGYGRAEAAHCCYMFARSAVKPSGADDQEADFVLLGANHSFEGETAGNDLDSILLTELYEYATSLSAPTNAVLYLPHLQAYKLVHAQHLAAHGLKSKAQTYVDAITSAYTSTTRPSPYYHPTFTQAVADFGVFLAGTPQDGKGGKFFSKPAMNKVSSGAATWFTRFVAGEDDTQSDASHPGSESAGPFGGVNGGSPAISRNGSTTDLYQTFSGGMNISAPAVQQHMGSPPFAPSSAPGRYTPGGVGAIPRYPPSSSGSSIAQPYASLGMPAAEPQRPHSSRYAPAPSSTLGIPAQSLSRRASDQSLPYAPSSRRGSAQDTSSVGSYEPRPILADEGSSYSYSPVVRAQNGSSLHTEGLEAEHAIESAPLHSQEGPAPADAESGGYAPPTTDYEAPSGGYEPPSYSTYQPYEPEPDSPVVEKKPKKTFGDEDEDDDIIKRAAALKQSQADRAADDAFRKAAEADAARDKAQAEQRKGWLTGWFGGKNKDGSGAPGPIKAKLGEENSFYYDENLKKWVNKKAGAEAATPAAATPPPPKGPAARVASSEMPPPSGPPSRASSGMGPPPARPPTSGSGPAFPPSGPPSRTGTPASMPSSDRPPSPGMNGDATGHGPPIAAARPSSSLSTASSIDDLLGGPPGARKAGTLKGKKKGGRYVDVMAK